MKFKKILSFFSNRFFTFLSKKYKADYKVQKLVAQKVFYVILYAHFFRKNVSLRGLSQDFNDILLQKKMFGDQQYQTIHYSSFHYRLDNINPDYYKSLYEKALNKISPLCTQKGQKTNFLTFDSTTVSLSSKVLSLGFKESGNSRSNSVKFTVGFDGWLPQSVDLYTEAKYGNENNALGETILNTDIAAGRIILFDRGISNRALFDKFTDRDNLFITRLNSGYKIDVTNSLHSFKKKNDKPGDLIITKEQQGYLYSRASKKTKHTYRVIHCKSNKRNQKSEKVQSKARRMFYGTKKHANKTKDEIVEEIQGEELIFVTNIPAEQMDAQEIAACYKKRWDIEKFFRFIKQELNFKHFLNRSEKGILSLVYIRMILAILILFYKLKNNLKGYKPVKNAIRLEIMRERSMLPETKKCKQIRAGPIPVQEKCNF